MLIAGDLGGTKVLLRWVGDDGATLLQERYESAEHASFDDVLRAFVSRIDGSVDAACFAVAGPVYEGQATVTNVGWTLSEASLSSSFSIPHVSLINDFYAIALGVPLLGADDLICLQQGTRDPSAPIGVLGAGTGLGEAILIKHGDAYHVIPSEGGHQDFAPQDEEQTRLFLQLHRQLGHVSWERLVSGMGLVNIFTFLTGSELTPAEISERAERGDKDAVHAFEMFVDVYGAEAGNMALRVLARGGVYLAGGIAAKNVHAFTDGNFIKAFRRKGRFEDLMKTIPCHLITNEEVGLVGAVEAARRLAASR
jgi:glucokinase